MKQVEKQEPEPKNESSQAVLDELLDKINRLGYDRLTPAEKEMLHKASKDVGKDNRENEEDADGRN